MPPEAQILEARTGTVEKKRLPMAFEIRRSVTFITFTVGLAVFVDVRLCGAIRACLTNT
jgi:hypothetical protein